MNEESYDFAIAGDTVHSALLALFLCRGRAVRVCVVGPLPAPLQLLRGLTLSPGPHSRPDTLALVEKGTGEVRTLFGGRGEAVLERRNVQFAALTPGSDDAAGHVRHMLAAFGAITASRPGGDGFVVEGAWHLRSRALFSSLPARFAAAGIGYHPDYGDLQIGRDRVRFRAGHSFVSAGRLIVAGPAEAAALGPLPDAVVSGWRTALLTDPVAGAAGRLVVDIATGCHLIAHADGRVEATAPTGDEAAARCWLAHLLPPSATARIVAAARIPVLLSRDGAPFVWRVPRKAATLIAGFGVSGGFLAPALARILTLDGDVDETAYFSARGDGSRAGIAEIGLIGGGTP